MLYDDPYHKRQRDDDRTSSEKYIKTISEQISKCNVRYFNTIHIKQCNYDALVLWCIENGLEYECKGWYTRIDLKNKL